MPQRPRKRTHQQKVPLTPTEIINKLVVWLQDEIPYALRPVQESAFKQHASRLLSESKPAETRTKTARRRVHPPQWATEMVGIFNHVQKVNFDTFVIDDRNMVAYRELMKWWNLLQWHGVSKPQIDRTTLATRLFCCAFVSFARSQSTNAREFCRAALTVIAVDHLSEMAQSEGWRFRFQCCDDPRCGQWFLDRSPQWLTAPARFCSDRHRARTFKARRKASHASS